MTRVLILEDSSQVLDVIFEGLKELEKELGKIESLNFQEGRKAREFVEENNLKDFQVILLDKISSDEMNFHEAVLDRIDPSSVIAISNTDTYNREAQKRGVQRIVRKDYRDLKDFKGKLKEEIKFIILNKKK